MNSEDTDALGRRQS